RLVGRTLGEARGAVTAELARDRAQLDALAGDLVERGLAVWAGPDGAAAEQGALIVRGQSRLLEDVAAIDDLERVRRLFSALERKETLLRLLDLSSAAQGVRIFIGAENELFRNAGCSLIISPYTNADEMVVGAIGVIGPTRMNYARIIPMVDYTATVVGRLIG
ncbi:MAG: heat-inducible transcriptional repressor HrcA, partial [Rhodospirillaceae bacterium]|nr:heat-inducible transcriptional repressor HrcA [Rhodospirillaceae bacterium]